MEAPEKIYITPNFQRRWFTKEIDEECTEYIRQGVFIEKTCEWLSNAFHKNCNGTFNYVGGNDCSIQDIINVFRQVQKG